jgi:hypothetical protein
MKLIVVDDPIPGKTAGGVQLLAKTLSQQRYPDLEIVLSTSDQVLENIAPLAGGVRTTIYIQKSGSLSPSFLASAQLWLAAGARVIEKNVFARASRFRPIHPEYHMALMSEDGAFRFVLRSLLVGGSRKRTYLHLSPPFFESTPVELCVRQSENQELTLLRIGRPDPIKWSDFERDFAVSLARSFDSPVRLVRVGYPAADGQRTISQIGNLTVEDIPYLHDTSGAYGDADIYLHHSRIGETFGNTLAEAKNSGLPVIMAVDLHWDCAGTELLSKSHDIVGKPEFLVRTAAASVERVMQRRGSSASFKPQRQPQPERQCSPLEFIEALTPSTIPMSSLRDLPSFTKSVSYVWYLYRSIEGAKFLDFIKALLLEPIRSVRHSRRLDP